MEWFACWFPQHAVTLQIRFFDRFLFQHYINSYIRVCVCVRICVHKIKINKYNIICVYFDFLFIFAPESISFSNYTIESVCILRCVCTASFFMQRMNRIFNNQNHTHTHSYYTSRIYRCRHAYVHSKRFIFFLKKTKEKISHFVCQINRSFIAILAILCALFLSFFARYTHISTNTV